MTREIKFRGLTKTTREWVFGNLIITPTGDTYIFPVCATDSFDRYEVDPETVGQYTGLQDQLGRDIYEGDIVYAEVSAFGNFNGAYVKFANGEFCFYKPNGQRVTQVDTDCYTVIGNIHDNPELLS